MDWVKSLQYFCVGLMALFSLNATAAQPEYVPGEVLIIPDTTFRASAIQAFGMKVLSEHKGKTRFNRIKVKPGQTVEQAVQALSNAPGIKHAQPNYIYHATAVPNDTAFANYWGLQNTGQTVNATSGTSGADIGASTAWNTITDCSSVTVAVVDTGVDYNHPELAPVIVPGWDFVQGDNDPMDFNQHGTHVAGTIGAAGNNANGGTGVCWHASILPVRVLGSDGSGTLADIAAGIDYAVANGAKIINMSLGSYSGNNGDLLYVSINAANTAGVLVVAAAGNEANDNDVTPSFPASYSLPNIISVAATDQNDALASFSNYGATTVDIAAPGVNIYSTVPPTRTAINGCSWDFDDGTKQGWSTWTYDINTLAEVTDTVAVTTEDSNSPSYSLTDSPGANYANDREYDALAPVCDLAGQDGARVDFALNLDTEAFYDYLAPFVFDGTTDTALDWVSGSSGGWFESSIDLQNWVGQTTVQVGWLLQTDATNVSDGVHVDDVAITVPGTVHTGSEYDIFRGTSMAAPHVAGAAALVWAAEPTLTMAEVRTRILTSGDTLPSLSGFVATGMRLNVAAVMPTDVPTGLTATINGAQVDLTWTDNFTGETSYEVWRNDGTGYTNVVSALPANTSTYSDTSTGTLAADTRYTYRVYAVDAVTPRTTASNTVTVATAPAAATGLSATATGTSIALAWTDNSSSETMCQIQRNGGSGYTTVATLPANSLSYIDAGLSGETTYTYRVYAVNEAGSTVSSTASDTTQIAAPSGLSAAAASASQINLTWVDNSAIETSYVVQRYSSSGYTTIATLAADSQSYSDTGLTASTNYVYRVIAVGSSSATSNSASANTKTPSSGGGGGGGSSDWWMLLMLTSLTGFVRLRRKQ